MNKSFLKFITDFGPLLIFFTIYYKSGNSLETAIPPLIISTLVTIAIMLPTRNPDLSPWLSLLICAYPILETIVSIVRKTKRKGHNAGMPDKLHLHMLVHRDLARKVSKSFKVYHLRNSTTSVIMWVLPLSHSLFAILFYDKIVIILVSIIISYFTYVYIYKKCTFK